MGPHPSVKIQDAKLSFNVGGLYWGPAYSCMLFPSAYEQDQKLPHQACLSFQALTGRVSVSVV